MADAKTLAELRDPLFSVSWLTRCTSAVITRMVNAEDECIGRFWQGRFTTTVLPDEAAVAACTTYVNLNPVRAGLAAIPEKSDLTIDLERFTYLKSAGDSSAADAQERAN